MSRKVAFCWELGGGFGHFSRLGQMVDFFDREGFEIAFITRDVWSAGRWFEQDRFKLFQAPLRHGAGLQFTSTPTFAHILHNVGYGDPAGLFALASGWKSLFELIRPDLIVADHSPTAILAARGLSIPVMLCGSGFGCPPDESPLSDLQPWLKTDPFQLASVETKVLDHINRVLERWGGAGLDRITQLYYDGPQRVLLTFEELDHFPNRKEARYLGHWPFQPGQHLIWPAGSGPKIFAYLKRTPRLPNLLQMLGRKPNRTVVFAGSDSEDLRRRFQTPTLQISDQILDLAEAGRAADIAITNGNHGTTTAMLLSGVPVLTLPLHLEQLLIGKAVERMGSGTVVSPENISLCEKALHVMSSQPRFRESAQKFATRHQDFSRETYREAIESEFRAQLL